MLALRALQVAKRTNMCIVFSLTKYNYNSSRVFTFFNRLYPAGQKYVKKNHEHERHLA